MILLFEAIDTKNQQLKVICIIFSYLNQHKPIKEEKEAARTTVNLLKTLITHDERVSVYNFSDKMFPNVLEKKIKGICRNKLAIEYVKTHESIDMLYECSKISIYNTEYKRNHP